MRKKNHLIIFLVALTWGIVFLFFGVNHSIAADVSFEGFSMPTFDVETIPRGCSVHEKIKVPPGYPKVPRRPPFLGVLKGSWYEIGRQYGEKSGYLMRYVFDSPSFYSRALKKYGFKTLIEDLYRYEKRISEWNPEYIDLMKGIAAGASSYLDQSKYAAQLSHYEKVLYFQVHSPINYRHPVTTKSDPDARKNFPVTVPENSPYWKIADSTLSDPLPSIKLAALEQDAAYHDCTSIIILPEASANGKTLIAQNTQTGFGIGNYAVSFVVDPPQGNRFWTIAIPGMFLNNKVANEKGVSIAHMAGGKADCAFGVPWLFLLIEAMTRANTYQEAVDILTVGTPEYRERTGRKTVLREGGMLWPVADETGGVGVEVTSRYYGIRKAGYLGEKGFIVVPNHYYLDYSIDENNVRTNVSMIERSGCPDNGKPGTSTRHWSGYWKAMFASGRIDVAWLQKEFLGSHVWYNRQGQRTDYGWSEKHKMYIPIRFIGGASTICSHRGGYPESYFNEVPCPYVYVPADRTVYWIVYKPCFWVGPWESLTFK